MFNTEAFAVKTQNDILFFGELFKKYSLEESEFEELKNHLRKTYILAKEIFEECDILPLAGTTKLRSKNILQEMSESDIVFQQYKKFSKEINKDYIQPLTEGSLNVLYENETNKIIGAILNTENNLDTEIAKNYAIFESVLSGIVKDFIIPKDNLLGMIKYASSQSPEYFNVFDRNIKHIKEELNFSLEKFVSCLAIKMFKAGIQFAEDHKKEDYNFDSYKGLSKILNKDQDDLDLILSEKQEAADKIKENFEDDMDHSDQLNIDDILNKDGESTDSKKENK